jgi:hypothetical protein
MSRKREPVSEMNMRTNAVFAVAIGAVVIGWTAQSMSGQVQPVPGPGTGIVTVQGEVDVRRLPAIDVAQRGEWRVDARVLAMPAVSLAPVGFVRPGGRYLITWSGGESETIAVAQTGDGAWVRTTASGRRDRWLNLAQARAVEEAP